jgi:beta-glucanase (GH16 family)
LLARPRQALTNEEKISMASTLDLTGYKLTLSEEFNRFAGSADGSTGTWKTTYSGGVRTLSNNGEHEFYADSSTGTNPFGLENGALTITAAPAADTAETGGLPYTSGVITTQDFFEQQYGYFEMRAQLAEGEGMWPAFWMLSQGTWPPELDVLEAFGAENSRGEGGANELHTAVHTTTEDGYGEWNTVDADLYDGYHTYGVKWEADKITYYFDGEEIGQTTTPADMHQAMYLIANLAVGGHWPESPDGDTAQLKIDYIRAYSKDPNAEAVALDTVSSPDGADTSGLYGATAANAATTSGGATEAAAAAAASASDPVEGTDVAADSTETSDAGRTEAVAASEDSV